MLGDADARGDVAELVADQAHAHQRGRLADRADVPLLVDDDLPDLLRRLDAILLLLTGRIIDADESYRIRLVHEVVAPDELMTAALKMARLIVENNAYGVWQTKIGLNTALDAPSLRHAKEIETRTQILSGFTNNPLEAAKAHQEKRAAVWDPL